MLIEYTQSLLRLARRAVLYHVRDTRPRLVLLPVLDEWDEACGADVGPEDLDAGGWIPHHRTTISAVDYFPGTTSHLSNGYDIICLQTPSTTRSSRSSPTNNTLNQLFSVEWPGNLVIVKRARYRRDRAVHITPPEISLINTVVQQ